MAEESQLEAASALQVEKAVKGAMQVLMVVVVTTYMAGLWLVVAMVTDAPVQGVLGVQLLQEGLLIPLLWRTRKKSLFPPRHLLVLQERLALLCIKVALLLCQQTKSLNNSGWVVVPLFVLVCWVRSRVFVKDKQLLPQVALPYHIMLQLLRCYAFIQYLFLSFNLRKFKYTTKVHAHNVSDVFMPYWVFFIILVILTLLLLAYLVYSQCQVHRGRAFLITISSALLVLLCFLASSSTLVSGLILSVQQTNDSILILSLFLQLLSLLLQILCFQRNQNVIRAFLAELVIAEIRKQYVMATRPAPRESSPPLPKMPEKKQWYNRDLREESLFLKKISNQFFEVEAQILKQGQLIQQSPILADNLSSVRHSRTAQIDMQSPELRSGFLEGSIDDKLFERPQGKIMQLETETQIRQEGFRKVKRKAQSFIATTSQENLDTRLPLQLEKRKSEELSSSTQSGECKICFNSNADVVLCRCGHSGLCYRCALRLWHRSGLCPICRMTIEKVIQIDPAQQQQGYYLIIGETILQ